MRHDVMIIDGEPVVLCFIAWMRAYSGVRPDDTPIWDGDWAPDGYTSSAASKDEEYFLGESSNFSPARRKTDKTSCAFGHVQANFDVSELGGKGDVASNVTVIWCASDVTNDDRVRVVGWYRGATVYRSQRPLKDFVLRSDQRLFPDHEDFNIVAEFKNTHLFSVGERPFLQRTPGKSNLNRWHAQSKVWYGEGTPSLVPFLKKVLALDPSIQPKVKNPARKPITWEQIQQTVRARQGQSEFRKLLKIAYRSTCAISGCKTEALLDACHIYPASKSDSYHGLENGLLLRTDLHTLFDLGLLAIRVGEPPTVWVSPTITDEHYRSLHGRSVATPQPGYDRPSRDNLSRHWKQRKVGQER